MSRNRDRFAALFRTPGGHVLPTLAAVNLPPFHLRPFHLPRWHLLRVRPALRLPPWPVLLAFALPGFVAAQTAVQSAAQSAVQSAVQSAAQTAVPSAAITQALALVSEAAAALAPAGARVLALPGEMDSRLRLAPCTRISAFMVPGAPAWGRTRAGLRCDEGPARWAVYLPVNVQVWAAAVVPAGAMAAGARLEPEQLKLAEVDWAATAQPPFADPSVLAGRVLARGVPAGQALRAPDLQARQWFAAGDPVRVVANGPGFAISTDGQAVSAGIEGQRVRVRIGQHRVVEGRAVAHRVIEVGP